MTITLDVPESVVTRAEAEGVPVADFVPRTLENADDADVPPGFERFGSPEVSAQEAGRVIREIASRHTLNGLKVKDLIEERRRL